MKGGCQSGGGETVPFLLGVFFGLVREGSRGFLLLTSASDHALPPPVETVFLCRCIFGTWRLDMSEDEFDLAVIGD